MGPTAAADVIAGDADFRYTPTFNNLQNPETPGQKTDGKMDHDGSPDIPVSFIQQAREEAQQESSGHVIKWKLYMEHEKEHGGDQGFRTARRTS